MMAVDYEKAVLETAIRQAKERDPVAWALGYTDGFARREFRCPVTLDSTAYAAGYIAGEAHKANRDEKLREIARHLASADAAKEQKAAYTPPASRLTPKELAAKAAKAKPRED